MNDNNYNEIINDKLNELNKAKKQTLNKINKIKNKRIIIPSILTLMAILTPTLSCIHYNDVSLMANVILVSSIVSIPPAYFLYNKYYKNELLNIKILEEINNEENTLKEELINEKDIKKTNERLQELQRKLEFYRKLSYNIKRYVKYYQRNEIREKLSNEYTQEEITQIEEYIEDNKLALRRR